MAQVPNLSDPDVNISKVAMNATQQLEGQHNFYVVVPIIYSFICAVGLLGNTAVIYVILRAPKMRTVTNMFILNLAIADELFTLVLPINIADHLLLEWPFGQAMCKLIVAIDHYNMFTSIYFLTVMSIDRYLVVLATVKSRSFTWRTYAVAKWVCGGVWALVSLVVLPFVVFASNGIVDSQRHTRCGLELPSPEAEWLRAVRTYTLIAGFVLPVTTICTLYTSMLRQLRGLRLSSNNARALDKAKRKVTLMVAVVLGVCLLCWTPYHLSTVVALTVDLNETPMVIAVSYFIISLSYTNSCLNPLLYAFLDESFRRSFLKLLECKAG
ncbi:neuropeptides B/W receptor type 1 [Petromyzon marinus]|uniref:neuropeptides B/W receptor type 1 n=1 Tax=Petromyzon marinus TaxID=7757 RepID=UPI003F714729